MISPKGIPIDFRLKFIGAVYVTPKNNDRQKGPSKKYISPSSSQQFQELILSQNGQISEMEVALVALVEDLETALDLYLSRIGSFWMGHIFFGLDMYVVQKLGPLPVATGVINPYKSYQ